MSSLRLKRIAHYYRRYKEAYWATIWEDAMGVHFTSEAGYFSILITGKLLWLRQKWLK